MTSESLESKMSHPLQNLAPAAYYVTLRELFYSHSSSNIQYTLIWCVYSLPCKHLRQATAPLRHTRLSHETTTNLSSLIVSTRSPGVPYLSTHLSHPHEMTPHVTIHNRIYSDCASSSAPTSTSTWSSQTARNLHTSSKLTAILTLTWHQQTQSTGISPSNTTTIHTPVPSKLTRIFTSMIFYSTRHPRLLGTSSVAISISIT